MTKNIGLGIEPEPVKRLEYTESVFAELSKIGADIEIVELPEIDVPKIKGELEGIGARFELDGVERESLGAYSNKDKATGVKAVWGDNFYDGFKEWTLQQVKSYEAEGQTLPGLGQSGIKYSGMRQLLTELTALAAGELDVNDFRRNTRVRIWNGFVWSKGEKDKREDPHA